MEKKGLIWKVGIDWGGTIFALLFLLYFFYLMKIWEWQRFVKNPAFNWLLIGFLLLYLYGQYRTTSYYLYNDKLVIRFPLRFFYRTFTFKLNEIDSILFYEINTLRVFSSLIIKCKSKESKHRFASTGNDKKMKKLLILIEQKGINVEVRKISGKRIH